MSDMVQDNLGPVERRPAWSAVETLRSVETFVRSLNPRAASNPEKLLDLFVQLLAADTAVLYERDTDRLHYRLSASQPPDLLVAGLIKAKFERLSAENGALAPAIKSRRPVFSGLLSQNESSSVTLFARQLAIPIVTLSPLLSRDEVPAVVLIGWNDDLPWDQESILEIAVATAGAVGASFEFRQIGQRRELHKEFLQKLADRRVRQSPDTLYHEFLSSLSGLVPTRFISLWLYDPSNDALVMRSFFPPSLGGRTLSFESFDQTVLRCDSTESGEVIKTLQPKVVDIAKSRTYANPLFARRHHLRWLLSFPILEEDEAKPLGTVNLYPAAEIGDFEEFVGEANEYVQYTTNTIRTAQLLYEESLFSGYEQFFKGLVKFEDNRPSWNTLAAVVRKQMECVHCSIFLEGSDGDLHLKGTTASHGRTPQADVTYKHNSMTGAHEGLTGLAFGLAQPLVYHAEFAAQYRDVHLSKFREGQERAGSIIFGQIRDENDRSIGIIRCVNKKEIPSRRPARFTREDVLAMEEIARMVSNTYSKARLVWESHEDKDRSFRSLYHEVIAPVDLLMAHINWLSVHLKRSSDAWQLEKIRRKCDDMKQVGYALDSVVQLVAPFETELSIATSAQSLYNLAQISIGFIHNEARRNRIELRVGSMFVPAVSANAQFIIRVFFNLLRNAVKYSDRKTDNKYVEISAQRTDDGMVVVTVEDNGVGFQIEEIEQVFVKFKRGSNAPEVAPLGEGLGLYYCRQIVVAHGGRIWVESAAKPTKLSFSLPLAEARRD